MMRDIIDFASVRPEHYAIHGRLENWARWCSDRTADRGHVKACPMFDLYRSSARARAEYAASVVAPVDRDAAQRMQKAVSVLPERWRLAIVWSYVRNAANPRKAAADFGVSKIALADLVHEGRTMLINRGA